MMPADLREPPADGDTDVELDPRRRLELLHDCRDLVVSQLTRFIAEALDRLSIELTITAMKAAGRESQQALLDALSLVRLHRNDIEYRFRQTFAEIFEQRLFDPDAAARAPAEPAGGELALVDDDAIEDRIALERLVRRSRRQLDPDEVLGVRARLAALLGREWFDEDDYPASPEVVFEALQRSLDELSPPADVRTALLQAFEPHVTASLGDLHASVNERLKSHHVLPTVRPRAFVPTAVQRPGHDGPDPAASAAARHPPSAAAPIVPGAPASAGVAHGGANGASPPAGAGFDPFGDLVRQLSTGEQSARRSAARLLANPDTFGMADLPIPVVEAPLLEALHTMQSVPTANAPGAPELATQLLDHARAKGSSLDQLTVEIVSLVFDYIYSDRRLPDPVKQQLLRLQVVAVKAALLDRSFFARRQHPMRRLIDRITDLATDPDADFGEGSTLVPGVAAIVDWILEHFDDDLATFDEAMGRFDLLAHAENERRAARLLALTQEAERLEALAVAQDEANAEIALRIDPVTPAFVREFLFRSWSSALAQARVDGQCAGASWADALHSAELLIWSVAPKAPDDIPRLASLLPRMIGSLMKGLKALAVADAERERFFNELLKWHTRAIQDAKTNVGRTVPAAASAFRMDRDGTLHFDASAEGASPVAARKPASGPSRSAEHPAVDALRRGDLIEFDDDDGSTQTVKLAWISPTRKLYVLSRFPGFGRSLGRAELVSWFASGRARSANARSAVDRAIDAIAQTEVA